MDLLNDQLERPATVVLHAAVCCRAGTEAELIRSLQSSLESSYDFIITNFAKVPKPPMRCSSQAANKAKSEENRTDDEQLAVLIPERASMSASSVPLIKSKLLRSIVLWRYWNKLLSIAVLLGIVLTQVRNIPNLGNLSDDMSSGLGLLILGVFLTMHASMYDRGLFLKLLRNFQFWYLAIQVLLGVVCMTYEAIKLSDTWTSMYLLTAVRAFGDGAIVVALFGLDASSLQRKGKGVVSLLVAVTFALWAYLWRVKESKPLDDVINLGFWTTTPRAVLQSVFLTESAFFSSYAFGALYVGHFTVMLRFLPQRLPLRRISHLASSADSPRRNGAPGSTEEELQWKIDRHLDLSKRYDAVSDRAEDLRLAHSKHRFVGKKKKPLEDGADGSITAASSSSPTSSVMNEARLLLSKSFAVAESHHNRLLFPSVVAFSAIVLCHHGEEEGCRQALLALLRKHSSLSFACLEGGMNGSDDGEEVSDPAALFMSSLSSRQNSTEAAELLCQSLAKVPSLFLHKDGKFHRWSDRRLLVPNTSAFISSPATLLPMWKWPRIMSSRHATTWNVFIFLGILSGGLMCVGGFAIRPRDHTWLACVGSAVYAAALACHAGTFKRDTFFRLLREFEFLYLVLQSLIMGAACCFLTYSDNRVGPIEAGVTVLFIVLWSVLQSVAIFGMDACFTRRKFKSALAALMCLVFFSWACICSQFDKDGDGPLNATVNIFLMKLSLRTVSQNVLATLALFCGKYACTTLILGNDAVLLRFECNRFLTSGVYYDEGRKMWIGSGSEIDYNLIGGGFLCNAKYLSAADRQCSFS